MIPLQKIQTEAKKHEQTFADCYAEADGNTRTARRLLRQRLRGDYGYGIDPATIALIFALIQLAFKVWKWAKDQGYLTAYAVGDVPMSYLLTTAYDAGELDQDDDEQGPS
jgi:hypothetical protein